VGKSGKNLATNHKINNMLFGQVNNRLDDKNRLSFPKKFRKEMGDVLIITRNMEGSLLVVSKNRYKTLLEGTENKPFILKEAREFQRFLFGSAEEVELDEKGRFILPEHLKVYSGIETDAVFVGVFNRVEIWNKKRWDEYNKTHLDKNISEIAKSLSEIPSGVGDK
jgi:MraZ protein